MPIFKKNPCFICDKQVGVASSQPTADGSRLCFDCMRKMGLGSSGADLKMVAKTGDTDLAAILNNHRQAKEAEIEGGIRTIEGIQAYLGLHGVRFHGNDSVNFQILIDNLSPNEEIMVAFSGMLNEWNRPLLGTAFALTNMRFIYASHARLLRVLANEPTFLKKMKWQEIRDLGFNDKTLFIDTSRWGKIVVDIIDRERTQAIFREMQETLKNLTADLTATTAPAKSPQIDIAEELRKLKQLEIDDIITTEEFEEKKRQLLGL